MTEFCLESTDKDVKVFRGTLDVTLTVAKPPYNMITKVQSSESKMTPQELLYRHRHGSHFFDLMEYLDSAISKMFPNTEKSRFF